MTSLKALSPNTITFWRLQHMNLVGKGHISAIISLLPGKSYRCCSFPCSSLTWTCHLFQEAFPDHIAAGWVPPSWYCLLSTSAVIVLFVDLLPASSLSVNTGGLSCLPHCCIFNASHNAWHIAGPQNLLNSFIGLLTIWTKSESH